VTDSVLIEGLSVEAVIGVYEWERTVLQRLDIDLMMRWDNRRPGQSDRVGDALNYGAVAELVRAWFEHHQPRLLEAAAEALAGRLQEQLGITWLSITIRKPGAVANARAVGVQIERGSG
jgi:dihydroneopterin aldolase